MNHVHLNESHTQLCPFKFLHFFVQGKGAVRQRVVIVGGSFAGLACARNLRKDFDVTIIDRKVFNLQTVIH